MNVRTWWKRLVRPTLRIQRQGISGLRLEELETRCVLSVTGFRPIDEVGNNTTTTTLGTAGIDLIRNSDTAYANGFSTPSMGGGSPTFVAGPRLVSNIVSNQTDVLFDPNPANDINTVNQTGLSDFGYTFGQFMDHDMDLTPDQGGQPVPPPPNTNKDGPNGFPIPKDANHPAGSANPDPLADPTTGGSLAFSRSVFDPTTGTAAGNDREQINANTAFLDLSQVYGSTSAISTALRAGKGTSSGGMLSSSPGADGVVGTADDLLPFDNTDYFTTDQIAAFNMANDAGIVTTDKLFAAGDVRANETTELTSLHTLFLRNHNRLAGALQTLHPDWNDEQLFQEAHKLNIAEYQNIVYNGFLPAILGPTAIPTYSGYNSATDPSIATEFSTVGYRFGHSLLNNDVPRDANDGSSVGDIPLEQSFFNPTLLTPNGVDVYGNSATAIDAIFKGDADNNAQAMDSMAVSSIRNLLFGDTGFGEDLIARDVWRAHDHGIGTFNDVRAGYGLSAITDTNFVHTDPTDGFTFVTHGLEQITSDVHVQALLAKAYFSTNFLNADHTGSSPAGDIDPFNAGIAEDHVNGSNLGPTFQAILVDQFSRLRDGDRFFYLNENLSSEEQSLIGSDNTLANVIQSNTGVTNLQDDVFHFFTQQDGKGKGYYTNKNGQAELTGTQNGTTLDATLKGKLLTALTNPNDSTHLVLVDANGNYLPTTFFNSYANVKSFLQSNGGNSMATKLSIQLLVAEINVSLLLPKVDATSSISVPAITPPLSSTLQSSLTSNGVTNLSGIGTVQNFLDASIAQLLAHPNPTGDDAIFDEALKDVLDAINANQAIFIQ